MWRNDSHHGRNTTRCDDCDHDNQHNDRDRDDNTTRRDNSDRDTARGITTAIMTPRSPTTVPAVPCAVRLHACTWTCETL